MFFLPLAYSQDYCATQKDDYLIKCTFHDDLFERDLLCLNTQCSDKMYTYDTNVFLLEVGNKSSFVYKDTINLDAISDNVFILKQICKEKFTDSFLSFLKRAISNEKATYSGEKNLIEPFTNENYERALNKIGEYECYSEKVEISGGWIVKSLELKEFCLIEEDKSNSCFVTKKSIKDYIYFGVNNSSDKFFRDAFSILLGVGIALGLFGFLIHIFENKKIDKFLKITKRKIIFSIIISIPLLYLIGFFVNKFLINVYFSFMILKEVLIIIGILLSYVISCIIEYFIDELN